MKATAGLKRGLAKVRRLWKNGDYPSSLREVDRLLADWPDLPALWTMRGNLIQLQSDESTPPLEEARAALLRAVELDDTSPAAWIEWGHYLSAVEDDAAAASRCFDKAISLARQQLAEALAAQAEALSELGK